MTRLLLTVTVLVTAGCGVRWYPAAEAERASRGLAVAARQTIVCAAEHLLPVASDRIGPLPLDEPLRALRQRCPAARDTLVYEHEAVFPAVLFPFDGLDVLAVQTRMDYERFEPLDLRADCPADY